jgi:2-oxoglutarate dehydrogenase E2 component (dihydrolipoamide succinyltransferase)
MSTKTIEIRSPEQEGTSAVVAGWLVAVGQKVSLNQPIAELETDKVIQEISAPAAGIISDITLNVGDEVAEGDILGFISEHNDVVLEVAASDANTNNDALDEKTSPKEDSSNEDRCRHLLGPAVRRLVSENNLDLAPIKGSGRGGRITRDDCRKHIAQQATCTPSVTHSTSVSKQSSVGQSQQRPHTPMRRAIAKHMVESLLHTSPHVTSVFELDMTNVIEHRKWHKKEFADKGVKLTFTAYFLKASALAMKAIPQVNSRFHADFLEIFNDVNIGVGTALGDDGLIVPVVQQVQSKDLFEIAAALDDQTTRARANKLTPKDMKGGTFTISNHGVSGSVLAAPIIINQPQVAILGIGKLEKRVVVETVDGNDQMVIRPKCYVTLTIDHRALDAHQTNQWLARFVDELEHWGE